LFKSLEADPCSSLLGVMAIVLVVVLVLVVIIVMLLMEVVFFCGGYVGGEYCIVVGGRCIDVYGCVGDGNGCGDCCVWWLC
jgi:hypothetical protein